MKLELNFSDLCQLALVVITKYFVLIDTHNRNVSNSCAYILEQNMVGANGLEPGRKVFLKKKKPFQIFKKPSIYAGFLTCR
ncbi:MAG: hypothetical protein ACLUZ7_07285 [Hominenteromicrobium sp.]|uniref:hypothetical protein n=1 Tax=Hominenteromicrobium sp. TaxID=3073581 RepID=UPI00399BA263